MFTRKILAAAATLAVAGTTITAGALTASAATPSCGSTCINIFPKVYSGTSPGSPQFVTDVFQQGAKVGQPIILWRSSNSDPAEDFTYSNQGTVSDFYAAGLVSSAVALHYGCTTGRHGAFPNCQSAADDTAYELEYSPYGVDSGLCVGLAATATAKETVTLQPCGVSGKTVWIQDANPGDNPANPYYAAINGSDTSFSHPFVLTYPGNGYPTDKPRPDLFVTNLTGFSAGVENDGQLWTGVPGVLP
jgi:hypothetical protein